MGYLDGKVALVTGASRGIGRACALKLASEGAHVIVNFLNSREGATETVREAQKFGVQAIAIRADVSNSNELTATVKAVQDRFGRLDVVVNNAAAGGFRPITQVSPASLESAMRHNAAPLLWLAQAAAPLMQEQGGGKFVAISSHGSIRGFANYGAIGPSKAALESLVRHLAFELGPLGISFNCVLSGMVDTEAVKSMPGSQQILKDAQDLMLIKDRNLRPDDVANAVAFLCSPFSDKIQGQTLIVDGGISVRI